MEETSDVVITIAGPPMAGKTTIALLIERVLRFNGLDPVVEDIDLGDTHEERQDAHADVSLQKARLRKMVERGAKVSVRCVQTMKS